MVLNEDLYRPGCRTPPPPVRRWRFRHRSPPQSASHAGLVQRGLKPAETTCISPLDDGSVVVEVQPLRLDHSAAKESICHTTVASVPCADALNPNAFVPGASRTGKPPDESSRYDYRKFEGGKFVGHTSGGSRFEPVSESYFVGEDSGARLLRATHIQPRAIQSVIDKHLFRLAAEHQPAVSLKTSGVPRPPKASDPNGRPRTHRLERAAMDVECSLYEDEVAEVRRTMDRRPKFRTHALRIPTFDLPRDDAHQKMTEDIVRDEILVKMKHNAESEIKKRAEVQHRRESMQKLAYAHMKQHFERSLALQEPHAIRKCFNVVAEEWQNQLEVCAVRRGFQLSDAAKAEQCSVARKGSNVVTSRLVDVLRKDHIGFSQTARERTASDRLAFLQSHRQRPGKVPKRPVGGSLVSLESRAIAHEKSKVVPPMPPPPKIAAELPSELDDPAMVRGLE